MSEREKREELKRGFQTVKLIWMALMGSLLVYVGACHFVVDQTAMAMGPTFPMGLFRNILIAVAGAELVVAYLLRKHLLSTMSKDRTRLWPSKSWLTAYMKVVLVPLAIADSVAIYGVVLYLLGSDFITLYAFVAVSAAAMVFFRPDFQELERQVRAARGPTY